MKYIKQSLLLLAIATSCGSFLHAGKLHDLVEKGDVKKVEQFLSDYEPTNGFIGIVELLFSNYIKIDINEQDSDGDTPLAIACHLGHKEIVKILLSHGADVNSSSYNGRTPLMRSCNKNHKEIVEILLSYGADINKSDRYGYTPLVTACSLGLKEIVEILLSHGADVNKPGYNGNTPLIVACSEGRIEIVKILLSYGADVNKPNNDNDTPIMYACSLEYTKIIKLLLSYGADFNKPCYNNKTPFNEIKEWSIEKQNELFKHLLSINQKKTETNKDVNARLFIEFNAADHADSFNQNKTLVPFIITNQQRKDLLLAGGFKEVKNKEFIISVGEEFLNTLFFRLEKNKNNTLPPVFIFEQSKMALHPYVKQLKIQRDILIFKNHNIKSYDDLIYKIKLLAFAQKSWKKWNKKQKSKVQFEDVTLNFKSDNSNSRVTFNSIK